MGKDELEGGAALGTESHAGPDPSEQGPPPHPASAGRAASSLGAEAHDLDQSKRT